MTVDSIPITRCTMLDFISGSDIQHLLITYGYWAVFAIVAVESMGLPLPGEMTLMAASIYAGTSHHLSIAVVILAAIGGAVAGDNAGYFVGRKGGTRILHRYGRYVRLDEPKLRLAQHLFDRNGGTMVFFGRFLPILRVWAGFLAGAHAMPWRRFLAFNAGGGIVWATVMGLGAYTFGHTAARVGGIAGFVLAGVALVVMASMMIGLKRSERRFQRAANQCSQVRQLLAA
ncbi:MAG TPA: DedA family protein [Chloroflexota bacterium]